MKAAKDQQRNRSWLRACLCGLVWAVVTLGSGADPMQGGRLEDYLKLLHYAPVAFKANARNEPLLEAEINGKKIVLFVDTGWRVTTLTPGSAAGLKTLGELGVELEDTLMGKLTNT